MIKISWKITYSLKISLKSSRDQWVYLIPDGQTHILQNWMLTGRSEDYSGSNYTNSYTIYHNRILFIIPPWKKAASRSSLKLIKHAKAHSERWDMQCLLWIYLETEILERNYCIIMKLGCIILLIGSGGGMCQQRNSKVFMMVTFWPHHHKELQGLSSRQPAVITVTS